MQNMKIAAGRTILADDAGVPMLVQLAMRPSQSAPNRVKAALVIPTLDADGAEGIAPMPFAQAIIGSHGKSPRGWTPEFRLELN